MTECFWCHVDHQPGGYRFCGECLHVYRTWLALRYAHASVMVGMALRRVPGDTLVYRLQLAWGAFCRTRHIYSCPRCSHDW